MMGLYRDRSGGKRIRKCAEPRSNNETTDAKILIVKIFQYYERDMTQRKFCAERRYYLSTISRFSREAAIRVITLLSTADYNENLNWNGK